MAAEIGPTDRTDFNFGSKRCPGRPILAKISTEIGQARPILLRGDDFDVTGHRAIGSYIARSVEVMISQYLIRLDLISRSEKN